MTIYDGRAIELALAGPTLFDRGVRLAGAVVEATFAQRDPPLLKRLRETDVPFVVDTQTLRFATPAFLDIPAIAGLPFAPRDAVVPTSSQAAIKRLAHTSLHFQQQVGARRYLAAGAPLLDNDVSAWLDLNFSLLGSAAEANGGRMVDRRPLLALVAPGRKLLSDPTPILSRLLDAPIEGVYVQPLNLRPTTDSVEKLALYVQFLTALKGAGLTVVAGRVGAFGLLLEALQVIDVFDSGLGQSEAYAWSQSVHPRTAPTEGITKSDGRRDRRVYLEPLKTTLPSAAVQAIIGLQGLRSTFTCTLGCCNMRGFEALLERSRQHFLWTRHAEINELRRRSSREMRVSHAYEELVTAREHARVLRRAFAAQQLDSPSFEHLERWIALLIQEMEVREVA